MKNPAPSVDKFYHSYSMHRFYPIIYLILACISFCLSQSPDTRESVLAKAGSIFITEKEFLERFELLPNQFKNHTSNIEESKLLFLYSLVAEKILAQEAEEKHFDSSGVFQAAISQVKRNLARDQLYREQIADKIIVPKSEIQKAVLDAKRKLFLSYLYFEDSTDAAFVKRQLNCRKFNLLRIDTTIFFIQDTATLVWGEAEADIENAAFKLTKGECSPVIKASTGYYILHLNREWPNSYYTSMLPDVRYARVEKNLRLRKEKARLDEYISNAFLNKVGYTLPAPFKIISKGLSEIWKNKIQGTEEVISDSVISILSDRNKSILQDSMIVIGSSLWTVEDVINKLRGKNFKIDHSRTTGIAIQLNHQLQFIVQQELLADEAIEQKLDERYSVKEEIDVWRQQMLANLAESNFRGNVSITDQDIFRYIAETSPNMKYPRVKIRELHLKDSKEMNNAISEINSGSDFEKIILKYSIDQTNKNNKGISEYFYINQRMPIGPMCWRMKIGERSGPHKINDEYVFFELLEKDYPPGISDTAFSTLMKKNTIFAERLKKKRDFDIYLAKSANSLGYAVYSDRLKMLKVSNLPMMTFRILGFGGRMFAAPFVTPQVDWIFIDNPETAILP